MQYPQYMLNPSDMFSVDIEKVLFATGAPKGLPRSSDPKWQAKKKGGKRSDEAVEAEGEGEEATATETKKPDTKTTDAKSSSVKEEKKEEKKEEEYNKDRELSAGSNWWDDPNRIKVFDPLKPYRTPWRPRYYLSAFAFIPKYLEVNHNIGHAVYLRDPVARPGQSEVCFLCWRDVGSGLISAGADTVPPRDDAAGVCLVVATEVDGGGDGGGSCIVLVHYACRIDMFGKNGRREVGSAKLVIVRIRDGCLGFNLNMHDDGCPLSLDLHTAPHHHRPQHISPLHHTTTTNQLTTHNGRPPHPTPRQRRSNRHPVLFCAALRRDTPRRGPRRQRSQACPRRRPSRRPARGVRMYLSPPPPTGLLYLY
jgi:ribosomal protein S4